MIAEAFPPGFMDSTGTREPHLRALKGNGIWEWVWQLLGTRSRRGIDEQKKSRGSLGGWCSQPQGTGGAGGRSWPGQIFPWWEWPRNLRTQMSNIKLCAVVRAGMRTTCSLYECSSKYHEQATQETSLALVLAFILSLQLNWWKPQARCGFRGSQPWSGLLPVLSSSLSNRFCHIPIVFFMAMWKVPTQRFLCKLQRMPSLVCWCSDSRTCHILMDVCYSFVRLSS